MNTYFEQVFLDQPRGLCCPSRSALVPISPTSRTPIQYGGSILLQDSPSSLAVSAELDPLVIGPGRVVQLYMYAFLPGTCSSSVCSLSDFFGTGGITPKPGNVVAWMQSNLTTAGQVTISSLVSFPIGSMKDSIGYQILFCFVDQGPVVSEATAIQAQMYGQPLANCKFPTVFPARVSYS